MNECLDFVRKAAGNVSAEEANQIIAEMTRRRDYLRAQDTTLSLQDAALQAADELGQQAKLAAVIEKRNAAINLSRKLEIVDYVKSRFGALPAEGLRAIMVGSTHYRVGARLSVSALQKEIFGNHLAAFESEIRKLGLQKVLNSGTMDRDIARALFTIDNPAAGEFKGPGEAMQIAKAMHTVQESLRAGQNKAGAWVGKIPGYIVGQSHDGLKIERAGEQAWTDYIAPRLDPKTYDGADPKAFLAATYKALVSGVHLPEESPTITGFKGPSNIAKRASQERVLHFKDADSWFDYNQKFGRANLREAFMGGVKRSADNTGLMQVMGTNPKNMLDVVHDELLRGIEDPKKQKQFKTERLGFLSNDLAAIDGSMSSPVHQQAARIAANVRAWESMARLGGSVISSFSDVANFAAEMGYQGHGYLSGLGAGLKAAIPFAGSTSVAQKEVLSQLGVFFDHVAAEIRNRFSADDTPHGKMSRAMQFFFRMNGQSWWDESLNGAGALMMAHEAAQKSGLAFDKIGDLKRTFELYGIDKGQWDILRSVTAKEADGRHYLTPEGLDKVPDAKLSAYLESQGQKATPNGIANLRGEIASKYRAYIADRLNYIVPFADARVRSSLLRGTQPGTLAGELLRFGTQFKSFPAAYMIRIMGREIYGRGSDTFGQALRNGNGEMVGLARLVAMTTAFGYLSMTIKDLLKDKAPRDATDPRTWTAAATQGGGLGIYGDFLFGDHVTSRFGQSPLDAMMGPTFGTAGEAINVLGKVRNLDDPRAAGLKFGLDNTPFINLFYVRPLLNYLVLWQMQEALNPGYLNRMQSQLQQQTGQDFMLRPQPAFSH